MLDSADDFIGRMGARAWPRAHQAVDLVNQLLLYRDARRMLDGAALAEWTRAYEMNARQLVALGVDALNDLFDTGSWPAALGRLGSRQETALDEAVSGLAEPFEATFGDQGRQVIAELGALTANLTVLMRPEGDDLHVEITRAGEQPIAMVLARRPASGDCPRISSRALLSPAEPVSISLPIARPAPGTAAGFGRVDAYGGVVSCAQSLLEETHREAETAQRFGRVRLRGEAPIVVVVIALFAAIAATIAYLVTCSKNPNSDECKVLEVLLTIACVFLGIALGAAGAKAKVQPTNGGFEVDYEMNLPKM